MPGYYVPKRGTKKLVRRDDKTESPSDDRILKAASKDRIKRVNELRIKERTIRFDAENLVAFCEKVIWLGNVDPIMLGPQLRDAFYRTGRRSDEVARVLKLLAESVERASIYADVTKEPRVNGEQLSTLTHVSHARENPIHHQDNDPTGDKAYGNGSDALYANDLAPDSKGAVAKSQLVSDYKPRVDELEDTKERLEQVLLDEYMYHQLRSSAIKRQLNDLGIQVPGQVD